MCFTLPGYTSNDFPRMALTELPGLSRSGEQGTRNLWAALDKYLAPEFKGTKVLMLWNNDEAALMSKSKPIRTLEDMKGMKIRTMQNPAHVESFKAMGANPTPLAYGELYGALQSGVVDGAEAANTNYHAQKFFEVAPNWAMLAWTVLISPLIMSEAKFKGYPADVQAALLKAGRDSAVVERAEYARSDTARLESLKKAGVKITTPDPAAFRTAVAKVYADFVKTDTQKKILDVIQSAK